MTGRVDLCEDFSVGVRKQYPTHSNADLDQF